MFEGTAHVYCHEMMSTWSHTVIDGVVCVMLYLGCCPVTRLLVDDMFTVASRMCS